MIECDKCHCFHQETDHHHIADESDEEVILENNELYKYLKEQCDTNLLHKPSDPHKRVRIETDRKGVPTSSSVFFSPIQRILELCRNFYPSQFTEKTPLSSPSHITREARSSQIPTVISVHVLPEYLYFIEVLLSSQLMLKDDLNILEHFIPNKEKHQMLSKKYSYEGGVVLPGALVLFVVGLNKYYFINNERYVLPCVGLTVSSYYLLHKLYTSYCLSKYKKDLNALITVVKNYSNLIHKNIQFIRDFESLSKIHSVRGPATALLNGKSNKEAWCKLPHLRFQLLSSLNTMCSLAYYNVLELLALFPFNPHLDPYIRHGLCCLELNELGICEVTLDQVDVISVKTLMKVKYIYFLLLSEFLSRIVLCFCPSSSSSLLHPPSLPSLFRLINRTSGEYAEQLAHLENIFNVVTIHKTEVESLSPLAVISNQQSADGKYEELKKTIECIEAYILFMLTQYKHMETNICSYQHSECIINDSVILQDIHATHESIRTDQLRALLYNIDCLNIQLSRAMNTKPDDVIKSRDHSQLLNMDETSGTSAVHVGYSDFQLSNVRDEMFLGIAGVPMASNAIAGGGEGTTYLDEDQINYYEFEKQFSSTVLSELKVKLKDKQVEWKRREELALAEKQQDDFSDLEIEVKVDEVKEDAHRKRRKRKSITKTHAIESLSDTEDSPGPKPHPPRSNRNKSANDSPRTSRVAPLLGSLITDGTQSSLLSTEDCEPNGNDVKYKRLYNLSRSQESYENRETSDSDEETRSRKPDVNRNTLAAQIEQVAREWKYTSIEEEFGDKVDEEEEVEAKEDG